MRTTTKKIDTEHELMLVFVFCLLRKQFREELLQPLPYLDSVWKKVGISESTLHHARKVVEDNKSSFVSLNDAIHSCMKSQCPDPPCPSEDSLADLVAAWGGQGEAPRGAER